MSDRRAVPLPPKLCRMLLPVLVRGFLPPRLFEGPAVAMLVRGAIARGTVQGRVEERLGSTVSRFCARACGGRDVVQSEELGCRGD